MKVAILGTENSHATAFSKAFRDEQQFWDIEVVGGYGYDAAANQKLKDAGLITNFADTPDAFVGKVDAVLVTARHGDHHYEYAMPYIRQGIHAFIDKPFTVMTEYAREMLETAQKTGAMLCGGSSLRFLKGLDDVRAFTRNSEIVGGYVGAPINMVNEYGNFYFYSQHLVELMFGAFGSDVQSVCAYCPDENKDRVSVLFDYGDFDVTGQYTSSYAYTVTAYAKNGCKTIYTEDLGTIYQAELREFAQMLRTGRQPHTAEELMKPVLILHAIEDSYKTGKRVKIL